MKAIAALLAGYVLGAKTGKKEFDHLTKSLRNLYGTTEFQEVINAVRAQAGASLRELAATVEGQRQASEEGRDLVDKVRRLVAPQQHD